MHSLLHSRMHLYNAYSISLPNTLPNRVPNVLTSQAKGLFGDFQERLPGNLQSSIFKPPTKKQIKQRIYFSIIRCFNTKTPTLDVSPLKPKACLKNCDDEQTHVRRFSGRPPENLQSSNRQLKTFFIDKYFSFTKNRCISSTLFIIKKTLAQYIL